MSHKVSGKSMLLIDTPIRCEECPCCMKNCEEDICEATGNTVYSNEVMPKWCPLIKLDMPMMDAILEVAKNPVKTRMTPWQYMESHK